MGHVLGTEVDDGFKLHLTFANGTLRETRCRLVEDNAPTKLREFAS